jgi:flagellar basal body-associated protein FliL
MSRLLIVILTILCCVLAVALVGMVYIHARSSGQLTTSELVAPPVKAAGEPDQKEMSSPIAVPAQSVKTGLQTTPLAGTDQPSVGVQAGQAVKEVNKKAQETYAEMSRQADKTAKDLSMVTEEMLKTFNEQFEKTSKELQPTLETLKNSINQEIQKFQETINSPDKDQKV